MLDTAGTVTRSGVRPWTRLIDAHVHIIDPAYPLRPDQGYLPEPFTISSYRARTCGLGVEGGAVVAGSFQGLEQDFMVDAARWVALIGDEGLWLIVFVTGYGHGAEREYPYFVESPRMPAEIAPAWVPTPPPWFTEAAAEMRTEPAAPARA